MSSRWMLELSANGSSGYQDKVITEENIHSELANSLPLEVLRIEALRGAAKVWVLYGGPAPYSHIFRL